MSKKGVDSSHISFRITNEAVANELAIRAEALDVSPNLLARELVTESLSRVDRHTAQLSQVEEKLDTLLTRVEQLDRMEQRLVRGVHLLLRYGGKLDAEATRIAMRRFITGESVTAESTNHVVNQEDGTGE